MAVSEKAVHACPICSRDRDSKEARHRIRRLVREHGGAGEMVNPGGRALNFSFGSCQLSDECNWCDLEKLESWLQQRSREEP